MDSKVVRADFGSGLIRPRAQTCMDSKVVRADFGSGLIRPRAQTCCASPTRTPARLANSPGFKSFRCTCWRIKFSLERFQIRRESVCVPSRWKVLSGEFRRRPTALVIKFRKPDRVGRRGLSEPREDFSRLLTLANQILARTFFRSLAHLFACPAAGKFSRASSAGGRRHL